MTAGDWNEVVSRARHRLQAAGVDPDTIHHDFWLWLPENLEIYRRFVDLALDMQKRRDHYSARAIFHVIRWETDLRGGDAFKVNNNVSAGVCRLAMASNTSLKKFFRIRNSIGLDDGVQPGPPIEEMGKRPAAPSPPSHGRYRPPGPTPEAEKRAGWLQMARMLKQRGVSQGDLAARGYPEDVVREVFT